MKQTLTYFIALFAILTAEAGRPAPDFGRLEMNPEERSAMEFLYSYLPTSDRIGYPPEFFLENVRASLKARREMPWGASVPEREFRHFVLPVRVNNENLDMSRPAFYAELRQRVGGLSIEDAILEVNHWCHEKVTYRPSDGRTSSPLSSVSQAIGRCGEESTFAVAALRAVGIPARQVYTPRWAHTDDNHAWVEAWANGRWHFLGACEPEPILDLAWFNAPASRGMLMTTKVFGDYDGPEEVLDRQPASTVINVTANYAPVAPLKVKVTDISGKPVNGAQVRFCLYNYAEFYPTAVKTTDAAGHAQLTTGIGEMLIWASDGRRFGYAKGRPGDDVVVVLNRDEDYAGVDEFNLTPPAPSASLPTPTAAQRRANDIRFAREDSIRNAYVSTFATPESAALLAYELGVDRAPLERILMESRGNHAMITDFLRSTPSADRGKAMRLLEAISEKDRRDVSREVLADALATAQTDSPLFDAYIMNPRIETEGLTPFKAFFAKAIPSADKNRFKADPAALVEWIGREIAVDTVWNRTGNRIDPRAAYKNRIADGRSRAILFVAMARSLGIPSRVDPVTGKPQYAVGDGDWIDALFAAPKTSATPKGKLVLEVNPVGHIVDPQYYMQFALSKIENGVPQLLEFDEAAPASQLNADGISLDAGRYMLVTGQRLADGSVMTRTDIFEVPADSVVTRPLVVRYDNSEVQVIGSFNSENLYSDAAAKSEKSLLSTTGRGYYVLGIIRPNHEPSAHALNEMTALADRLEATGRKIVLLFADADEMSRFNARAYPGLPSNVVFGTDINGTIAKELIENLRLSAHESERPIFVIADTFNRVVFSSQGYSIGLADRLLQTLNRIAE